MPFFPTLHLSRSILLLQLSEENTTCGSVNESILLDAFIWGETKFSRAYASLLEDFQLSMFLLTIKVFELVTPT